MKNSCKKPRMRGFEEGAPHEDFEEIFGKMKDGDEYCIIERTEH